MASKTSTWSWNDLEYQCQSRIQCHRLIAREMSHNICSLLLRHHFANMTSFFYLTLKWPSGVAFSMTKVMVQCKIFLSFNFWGPIYRVSFAKTRPWNDLENQRQGQTQGYNPILKEIFHNIFIEGFF